MASYFTVTVLTPDEVVFQVKVTALAAENSAGPFSIMADHARFIAILEQKPVILYDEDTVIKQFTLQSAVLYFTEDEARIYTYFEPASGYTDAAD